MATSDVLEMMHMSDIFHKFKSAGEAAINAVRANPKVPEIPTVTRKIDVIVVHCSASSDHQNIGAAEIDMWHKQKGWSGIGYHYVIRRSGKIEVGRPLNKKGAHCVEANSTGVGICLVGIKNFNDRQFLALKLLVAAIKAKYGKLPVYGHRHYDSAKKQGKTCPNFNVHEVL